MTPSMFTTKEMWEQSLGAESHPAQQRLYPIDADGSGMVRVRMHGWNERVSEHGLKVWGAPFCPRVVMVAFPHPSSSRNGGW